VLAKTVGGGYLVTTTYPCGTGGPTEDIEEDGKNDDFDTTKNVSNLGGRRLRSSSNNTPQNIDRGQGRVLLESRSGIWLVSVPQRAVQTICIRDEEDAEEDAAAVGCVGHLGTLHRTVLLETEASGWWW
jgi:hypothetical protein